MQIQVDFRSDTVTKPSPAMREAMARAHVDDDVLDGDPTVELLEERTARMLGQEAGLFMPSGSMANLCALMIHLGRGDRFYAPKGAHVLTHELGTGAWLAGGMPAELPCSFGPGVPSPDDIRAVAAVEPRGQMYYDLRTKLVCLENTHNQAGGVILGRTVMNDLVAAAHDVGWPVHLDGARIWHAAAAQDILPREAAGPVDSITVCFSKGLGAPVGSMLLGPKDFITKARRARKALGGGMRQSGVLAAAALVALEQELPRIDEDRIRATTLSEAIRAVGLDCPPPATNILTVRPGPGSDATAGDIWAAWREAGLGCLLMGDAVRLVVHRDIDVVAITTAILLITTTAKKIG
ncbi:MAG: aminotransferase class I/II-fold pyridoxal phosphate-dependent enzyme [Bifidobacteriaceae bacterium]|jgi:threonine aldolase|nr:aminotransferase class I/II-fold pyridoxal phosphate-dependent enzyme [Bifidobacteriaceae bacterium]